MQPGIVIMGRYVLERKLALGGMSALWVALDHTLGRQVAVKLLAAKLSRAAEVVARFDREARAVAQLQSPHIVQIFDYGIERDRPFIVMELLHGEDLRRRLKRHGRLPAAMVAHVVRQAAKGLSEAHAAGIVHRDLKPANVFFARTREDEVVKLLDFGVAKALPHADGLGDETTNAGQILGTPQFMSPEQARGRSDLDHRTDLWSLGVIIYQALTGVLPFTGDGPADIIMRIRQHAFAPPSEVASDVPPELDAFMARALASDPAQRFSSAREMSRAFDRVVAPTGYERAIVDEETTTQHQHAAAPVSQPGAPHFCVAPSDIPSDMPSVPSLPSFGNMPSMPTVPSVPSVISGTLGSAMLSGAPPAPRRDHAKQIVIVTTAALMLGTVAVAGTIVLSGDAPTSGGGLSSGSAFASDASPTPPDDPEPSDTASDEVSDTTDETSAAEARDETKPTASASARAPGRGVTATPKIAPPGKPPAPKADPYGSRF